MCGNGLIFFLDSSFSSLAVAVTFMVWRRWLSEFQEQRKSEGHKERILLRSVYVDTLEIRRTVGRAGFARARFKAQIFLQPTLSIRLDAAAGQGVRRGRCLKGPTTLCFFSRLQGAASHLLGVVQPSPEEPEMERSMLHYSPANHSSGHPIPEVTLSSRELMEEKSKLDNNEYGSFCERFSSGRSDLKGQMTVQFPSVRLKGSLTPLSRARLEPNLDRFAISPQRPSHTNYKPTVLDNAPALQVLDAMLATASLGANVFVRCGPSDPRAATIGSGHVMVSPADLAPSSPALLPLPSQSPRFLLHFATSKAAAAEMAVASSYVASISKVLRRDRRSPSVFSVAFSRLPYSAGCRSRPPPLEKVVLGSGSSSGRNDSFPCSTASSPLVPVLSSQSPAYQSAGMANRSRQVLCKAELNVSGEIPNSPAAEMSQYERIVELLTTLFPVWVTWLETDLFTLGLGFLMLSMGLTLTFEDFRRCMRNPWTVGVGFLAQYLVKPLLGFVIAMTLKLSAPLATGLILVSCCPGGQASNVATYISKGNVALSVLMTTASPICLVGMPVMCCSTIGAIVMTPLLTKLLAGQLVPVDAAGLAISTFQVVLVPTIVGVLANEYFPKFTKRISTLTPLIGVILTTLLCASPIGQVAEVLKSQGAQLIIPVALLHVAAFALGYWLSRLSTFGESTSRTISIECGMQSSALGFLLAQKHFTNPLVSVPSAVSVVCMALGGSALAVFWRNRPIPANDKDDFQE
ncbi:hypothetical protein ZIOFF_048074 [Zingiber officinale]|uniref:Uncharacterized protein n=3 Tax=Magnoliopsida TaxID=3398 RepID=A0A8J5KWC1_ZINOF|nr:hypothetical protein ZIOFF_048074 [Zingiber officinale]